MGNAGKKNSKKEIQQLIYDKLAGALAEYRTALKEKRFTGNLKKASKLFAGDIVKSLGKKTKQAKKEAYKKVKAIPPVKA